MLLSHFKFSFKEDKLNFRFIGTLSELLLIYQQILTASCENARTLPLFSRAGIVLNVSLNIKFFELEELGMSV